MIRPLHIPLSALALAAGAAMALSTPALAVGAGQHGRGDQAPRAAAPAVREFAATSAPSDTRPTRLFAAGSGPGGRAVSGASSGRSNSFGNSRGFGGAHRSGHLSGGGR